METKFKTLKKVKCKKVFGEWFYLIVKPTLYNDLDGTIYELYNSDGDWEQSFPCYGDMKYYIETGELL